MAVHTTGSITACIQVQALCISSIPLPPLPLPCSGHSVKGEVPLPGPVACGDNQTVILVQSGRYTHTVIRLQYTVQVGTCIYMYTCTLYMLTPLNVHVHMYMYIHVHRT